LLRNDFFYLLMIEWGEPFAGDTHTRELLTVEVTEEETFHRVIAHAKVSGIAHCCIRVAM
jgi:hypothetical protein